MSKKRQKKKNSTNKYELYFLLISTIIIIPLSYTNKLLDPNLSIRLFFLSTIILILFLFQLTAKVKTQASYLRLPIFSIYVISLIWTTISLCFSINPSEGLYELTKLTLFILLIILATPIYIHNNNFLDTLSKTVIIIAIISASIGLYQYFINIPGKNGHELFTSLYKVVGLMAHKNQYATSLFLMFPFLIYGIISLNRNWKIAGIISTGAILINIILVQTRAVWVALVFAIILSIIGLIVIYSRSKNYTIKANNKTLLISISAAIIVSTIVFFVLTKTGTYETLKYKVESIFNSDSHDNQGRIKIWNAAIDLTKDNLLLGVGPGCWKIDIVNYYKYNTDAKYQNWRRAHNDFIQITAEKGLPGLLLYLLAYAFILYYSIKLIKAELALNKKIIYLLIFSVLVGYLIISFFSFPYERINHQVYIAIMFSIILGSYFKKFGIQKSKLNIIYIKYRPYLLIIIVAAIYYSFVLLQSEMYARKIRRFKSEKNYTAMLEYSDKAFSRLTTLDALTIPIYHFRGEANIHLNNKKQAYKDFQKALQYFPGHISSLNNLAIITYDLNMKDKAFYYLDKTLDIFPKHQDALYNKTLMYYKNKEYIKCYTTYLSCYNKPDRDDKYIMLEQSLKNIINGKTKKDGK